MLRESSPPRDLFGTTWTSAPDGSGRFRCPCCADDRAFRRTLLQRHLTVLGRPILRAGPPDAIVTCETCGHGFQAEAAGEPDDAPVRLAEDEISLLGLLSAVIFSDSAVRATEKEVAGEVLRRYTGRALAAADFDRLFRSARRRWGDPVARLERLRHLVPDRVRQRMVGAAYQVCTADGELHREESRLLDRVGAALDLSRQGGRPQRPAH